MVLVLQGAVYHPRLASYAPLSFILFVTTLTAQINLVALFIFVATFGSSLPEAVLGPSAYFLMFSVILLTPTMLCSFQCARDLWRRESELKHLETTLFEDSLRRESLLKPSPQKQP